MARFEIFVWVCFMFIWVYALLDVIATANGLTRNLPKSTWLFIVLLTWIIGAAAWFFLGRPEKAGYRPGDTTYRKPINFARGPDDNPDFLRSLGSRDASDSPSSTGGSTANERDLERWEADLAKREELLRREEELRKREEELRRRESGDP